jgi:hypothetical protein
VCLDGKREGHVDAVLISRGSTNIVIYGNKTTGRSVGACNVKILTF